MSLGIPLDEAELLSTVLEGILYGFSLLGFGGTIWVLLAHRSFVQVNYNMVVVASLLLLCSTAHFVIDIIRVIEGLVLYRDTYTGGPIAFFSDFSQWTFVSKNYLYAAQTLIGDGVILYRCYVVWQSKLLMILPALLWSATFVTGIAGPYAASQTLQHSLFDGNPGRWITSFYATSFASNLFTTCLLGCRIWYIDHKAANSRGHSSGYPLRKTLRIIIDAALIYRFTLLVALIAFVRQSNGQFVIVNLIVPIISVTFYMIIVRVGWAKRAPQPADILSSLRFASIENDPLGDSRLHVV